MPVDVIDLPVRKQRYGLLLNDHGGIIDDLMFIKRDAANGGGDSGDIFVIVNGACKVDDIAHIKERIGLRCDVIPLPQMALLALQGPQAITVMQRLSPGIEKLVFMSGSKVSIGGPKADHHNTSNVLSPAVAIPVKMDSKFPCMKCRLRHWRMRCWRNRKSNPLAWALAIRCGSKRACACMATTLTPAPRPWRPNSTGPCKRCVVPGARGQAASRAPSKILAQLAGDPGALTRKRVGLVALERIPVRDHTELQDMAWKSYRRSHQRAPWAQYRQTCGHGVRATQTLQRLARASTPSSAESPFPWKLPPCRSFPIAISAAKPNFSPTSFSADFLFPTSFSPFLFPTSFSPLPFPHFLFITGEIMIKYTEDHEWLTDRKQHRHRRHHPPRAGRAGRRGVCRPAGSGQAVDAKDEVAGVVESVKAAADVYMPVSGEVTEVNEALRDDPSLANSDPLGAGWFFKVRWGTRQNSMP
jgi:glycine cleavage system H lipoate-binding protein